MEEPRFYVVSRIPGSPGSFNKWDDILIQLCAAAKTEPKGVSYYWSRSLSGSSDDIWGLEGFADPEGFFIEHPSSDVFKAQMVKVEQCKLLAEDYDVHHYHLVGGWLKNMTDMARDSIDAHVGVVHFIPDQSLLVDDASRSSKNAIVSRLTDLARHEKSVVNVGHSSRLLSCAVLNEIGLGRYVTLWIRSSDREGFQNFLESEPYRAAVRDISSHGTIDCIDVHESCAFRGHLDRHLTT